MLQMSVKMLGITPCDFLNLSGVDDYLANDTLDFSITKIERSMISAFFKNVDKVGLLSHYDVIVKLNAFLNHRNYIAIVRIHKQ